MPLIGGVKAKGPLRYVVLLIEVAPVINVKDGPCEADIMEDQASGTASRSPTLKRPLWRRLRVF